MRDRYLLQAVAMIALLGVAPAVAADMPVRVAAPAVAPVYSWSGFYVGGHLGWGWEDSKTTVVNTGALFPAGFVFDSTRSDGFIAGGQAGFNYQVGPWVFGIEGDISWAQIRGSESTLAVLVPNRLSTTFPHLDRIAMATGRLGYAFDSWLIYLKGGWAWGEFQSNSHTINTVTGAIVAVSHGGETRDGWTIGGGVEWGFAPNWSLKAEYNFIDFGTERVTRNVITGVNAGDVNIRDVDAQVHLVKAGINYHFNLFAPSAAPVRAAY
jgi:outer membrane immunogenic protein